MTRLGNRPLPAAIPLGVIGIVCLLGLGTVACRTEGRDEPVSPEKVEITTDSEEARNLYLRGRDLHEKLRLADAREYYEEALQLDPDFALVHMAMADTAPGTNEFWESMKAAVAGADRATECEQLMIFAAEARARRDSRMQLATLQQLVHEHPSDARVQNAMGQYYFQNGEWVKAVEHYKKATSLDPEFSQPYNQLGYALRFMERYDEAEKAFQKYIQMIPEEPNPYDSYAELLMKLGRHEESIENYGEALERNSRFVASYIGIGNNRIIMGQGDEARKSFAAMIEVARNDGERRLALLWMAYSYVHEDEIEKALQILEERYEISERNRDFAGMAGDLREIGMVLLEAGRPAAAQEKFDASVENMERSDAPDDNKDNLRRNHLFLSARAAIGAGDLDRASELASRYEELAWARNAARELRNHQELEAEIAIAKGDYAAAIAHLAHADPADPRVIFFTALAYEGKGDTQKAREIWEQVAHFNGLDLSYAFVRRPALRKLE